MADTNSRSIKLDGVMQRMPALDWASMLRGTSGNPIDAYMANRNPTPPAATPTTGPLVNQPQPRVLNVAPVAPAAPNTPTPQPNVPSYIPPANNQIQDKPQEGVDWNTFSNDTLELLNQAKGFSKAELLAKKRNLELETYKRSSALTPEHLRTMSPEEQRAYRVSGVDALSEEKAANAYDLQRQEDAVANFFNIYDRASKISQEFADKMAPPQASIDSMVGIIKQDPDRFDAIYGTLNDKGKEKLLNSIFEKGISLTKPTATKAPTIETIDGKSAYWNGSSWVPVTLSGAGGTGVLSDEAVNTTSLVGEILADDGYKAISGLMQTGSIPFTSGSPIVNKYKQLKAKLALGGRALLKGSGAVSDFESRTLEEASSDLGRNLQEADMKSALIKIQGALRTANGLTAKVLVTDPNTGETQEVQADSRAIAQMVSDGLQVNYI